MLIFHADEPLAAWAGQRLGMEIGKPNTSIGVAHRDQIVAVAVFNNFRLPNIEVTFVTSSPRWATRGAIAAILRYPFIQLGCKRVTAIIEATNQPARAFLCRLGFKLEGIHPDVFVRGAAETYGLLAHDARRWVAEEYPLEQIIPASPNAGRPANGLERLDDVQSRDGGGHAGHEQRQPGRPERLDHL